MGGETGRNRQARERFLQAGLEAWASLGATDALAGVTPRRVARQAGRQVGALYHHWPRIDLFHRDLLRWALDPARQTRLDEPAPELRGDQHPVDVVADLARRAFRRSVGEERAVLRFALASVALADSDPDTASTLWARHHEVLGRDAAVYEGLLAAWGRQVREPLTVEGLATVLAALHDGFGLWHLVDPEAASAELLATAAVAVLAVVSRPVASPVALDPFVRQLIARPVDARALTEGRARAAAAAAALYREGGWDAVTVPAVAARAGVEPLVVQRAFDGRDGLAAPVWASVLLPPLRRRGKAALRAGGGLDALVAYLRDLARVAGEHRAVTGSLLHVVQQAAAAGPPTAPTDPRNVVPIMDVPRRAAVAAFEQGALDTHVAPDADAAADLAAFATNFLLLRFLTRPAEAPEWSVELVERLVIDGLRRQR